MNSIEKVSSSSKIDSSVILDSREKLYFNRILQQELFALDGSAGAAMDSQQSSRSIRQAFLQGQALLGNIMALAEQG